MSKTTRTKLLINWLASQPPWLSGSSDRRHPSVTPRLEHSLGLGVPSLDWFQQPA